MLVWDEFLTQLEQELGLQVVDEWLRPLRVIQFDAANLYLEAQNSFQIHWFDEHIRPQLKKRFANNNSRLIRVHLTTASSSSKQTAKIDREDSLQLSQTDLREDDAQIGQNSGEERLSKASSGRNGSTGRSFINPSFAIKPDLLEADFTFAHFISPPDTGAIARKLLHELTSGALLLATFNPIFIYGPKNSGKTHLLTAVAHELKKQKRVFFVKAETFTEHVVQAIRLGKMQEFRHAYREIDVLIMDDIHIFSRKSATQEEFFHTFNTLHTLGQQIILSANEPPSQLADIEPRLISRFEWGITLSLEPADSLIKILELKADLWGLKIGTDVLELILEEIPSKPIEALQALALRSDSIKIEKTAARIILKDFIAQEQEKALTSDQIIKAIAGHFGIRPEDLVGKSQMREFAFPRQIAMYACREKLKMAFQKIGELFGRDHSTVMTSVKQIQKGIEEKKRDLLDAMRSLSKEY